MYTKFFKRVVDFIAAMLGLIIFSPILLILFLLIRLNLGTPVLFKQQRPGLYGNPFFIYKFRTMKSLYDKDGNPLPDEQRLTNFGQFLRKYSLDELPELFNVLQGDMSLVGPRPLLMEYLSKYTPEQARRHAVKPGITGWAQINGRNAISWEEKFKLDIWYVEHQSLWIDLKILGLTVLKVFKSEGINQKGHATMEKFGGTKQ